VDGGSGRVGSTRGRTRRHVGAVRRPWLPVLLLGVLAAGSAGAGHELPFYPSYYPQEIRVERLEPSAAARELAANTLHAYVGADPFGGGAAPKQVAFVESLRGYLVLTFDTTPPAWQTPEARCLAARTFLATLASDRGYVVHPYLVTPEHPDYLQHADRAQVARARVATGTAAASPLRVRAADPVAERALAGGAAATTGEWDATLEAVDLDGLLGPRAAALVGQPEPPWRKAGWYHAYLLAADRLTDPGARRQADELVRRLTRGEYADEIERLGLERELVLRLGAGCERVVVGYTMRREPYNVEFSGGIENVAADSQDGLDSAIFVRTAKLKDFPWNGWLRVGVPGPLVAAWNPVAGFTDRAGRLVWSALADPAFFPTPRGGSWIGNRVTVGTVSGGPGDRVEVPVDALLPEPETGRWRAVGSGRAARTRVVVNVLASAFHDGSRMAVADTLYGLGFAQRWSTPGRPRYDPTVEAATRPFREGLAGLRLVRVDTNERELAEVKFTTVTQVFEVYAELGLGDPQQLAAALAPWSAVPWPVLVLMEEAVARGLAALSEPEARRLGLPWLDLARNPVLREKLAALLDELAGQAVIPPALDGRVTPDEARARWTALRDFFRAQGHLLVTNGPYRLKSWADGAAVLEVFRDLTYPLGVGSYDRYPIPLRAYVGGVESREGRLWIQAEVETLQKFLREYAITRQPLRGAGSDVPTPVCRFVAVAADSRVVRAGTLPYAGNGAFALDLRGAVPPGSYTVAVLLTVPPSETDPDVRLATYQVGAAP
jgi:hypothetical protein